MQPKKQTNFGTFSSAQQTVYRWTVNKRGRHLLRHHQRHVQRHCCSPQIARVWIWIEKTVRRSLWHRWVIRWPAKDREAAQKNPKPSEYRNDRFECLCEKRWKRDQCQRIFNELMWRTLDTSIRRSSIRIDGVILSTRFEWENLVEILECACRVNSELVFWMSVLPADVFITLSIDGLIMERICCPVASGKSQCDIFHEIFNANGTFKLLLFESFELSSESPSWSSPKSVHAFPVKTIDSVSKWIMKCYRFEVCPAGHTWIAAQKMSPIRKLSLIVSWWR